MKFRPSVVPSKLVKFLEGLIVPKLKEYIDTKLHKNQYGFRRGFNLDNCRYALRQKINELNIIKDRCNVKVVFYDFS
jgi:hypothetical protein